MGFVDRLKEQGVFGTPQDNTGLPIRPPMMGGGFTNSSGGGGDPSADINEMMRTIMPYFDMIRNRKLSDFKKQQAFVNPSLRQPGLQRVFDPNQQQQQPMDVVYQPSISDYQRATLGLDERKLNQDRMLAERRIAEDKQTGEEKLGLERNKFGLDQQKNAQIYETKIADMERKAEEANKRLQLASDQLELNKGNANATASYHQAQIDATNARHDLDLAQKDKELTERSRMYDARIAEMQDAMDKSGGSTEETNLTTNADTGEQKRTTTIRRGSSAANTGTIKVTAPNGKTGSWPANEPLPKGYTRVK